jgi:hypothetical protein
MIAATSAFRGKPGHGSSWSYAGISRPGLIAAVHAEIVCESHARRAAPGWIFLNPAAVALHLADPVIGAERASMLQHQIAKLDRDHDICLLTVA